MQDAEKNLKAGEKDLDELNKCGSHLVSVCEPVVSQSVERTLSNVRERCVAFCRFSVSRSWLCAAGKNCMTLTAKVRALHL